MRFDTRDTVAFLDVVSGSWAYEVTNAAAVSLSVVVISISKPYSESSFAVSAAPAAFILRSVRSGASSIGTPMSGSISIRMYVRRLLTDIGTIGYKKFFDKGL